MSDFAQRLLRSHCYAIERATANSLQVMTDCELTENDRRNLKLARERIDALLNKMERINAAA